MQPRITVLTLAGTTAITYRPQRWGVVCQRGACAPTCVSRGLGRLLYADDPCSGYADDKAINPRTWIQQTDYLEQDFQAALRAFTEQRSKLLAVLEPLPPEDWMRTNTLIGTGKPLQQTLLSHADGLARHERAHLK
jgi:hypothetical protein